MLGKRRNIFSCVMTNTRLVKPGLRSFYRKHWHVHVCANYFALSHHATKIKIKNNNLYFFYFHIDRRILDKAINTLPRDISINEDTCRK
jgi:hypothetical protein